MPSNKNTRGDYNIYKLFFFCGFFSLFTFQSFFLLIFQFAFQNDWKQGSVKMIHLDLWKRN